MILKHIKKTDAVISVIIGTLIGIFFWFILRNLSIDLFGLNWLILVLFPPASLLGMIIASIIGKKFLSIYQFAKFILVGALNTFIDLGILNLLMGLTLITSGVYYAVFKSLSFLFAAVNSYFWNKHWTFEKKENLFSSGEFTKFFIVTLVGFLINVATATFVVNIIGPQYGIDDIMWGNIGAFTAVFTAFLFNFFGSKFIVFKK